MDYCHGDLAISYASDLAKHLCLCFPSLNAGDCNSVDDLIAAVRHAMLVDETSSAICRHVYGAPTMLYGLWILPYESFSLSAFRNLHTVRASFDTDCLECAGCACRWMWIVQHLGRCTWCHEGFLRVGCHVKYHAANCRSFLQIGSQFCAQLAATVGQDMSS